MKISAIRLKEVGRFSVPVALEGLSGGLNVLSGPNEFGKSTILKALRAALFEQYRSKHRKLETLRPYAGGAPLVEVEFEAAGRHWRLRKQFLSAPAAELRDLNSDDVARGADAETRLAALLGGAGHFALLCAEQGAPLAAMTPIDTGGPAFMAAIERELESITDGSATRRIAERVRAELANLVTSHNPPRPSGALKAAIDQRDDLARRHTDADRRLREAQERIDKLDTLRARMAQLTDTSAIAASERAAGDARRAFDDAREARQQYLTAERAVAACQQHLDALKLALDIFDRQLGEFEKLERAAQEAEPQRTELKAQADACAAGALETRKLRDAQKAAFAALDCSRRALEASERLSRAREADAARTAACVALAENAAEETLVSAARREAAAILKLETRLTAAAPRISMHYSADAAARIMVDGRALADGEVLTPVRPLLLEIEGIGTLTIAPTRSEDTAHDAADLDARRAQLAALLQRVGAASLDDAERMLAERRAIEADIAGATAQLKAVAPQGLERLQRAHDDICAQATALGAAQASSQEDVELRAEELTHALESAEQALSDAMRDERRSSEALATNAARSEEQGRRIAQLMQEVGAPEQRARTRAAKLAAFEAARADLNAAVREATAWREKSPDEARFAEMKRTCEASEASLHRAKEELASLRRTEAGLEGELRSDRAEDVSARVDELTAQLARAETRCRDLQEEAAALQLLSGEFDAAAARTHERFARPVIERLEAYLQLVIPQAQLTLGDDLAPRALRRGTVAEELTRLSDGTQEQLSLLVRLAFARLLADGGTPAPLILDDALAYAGDERMGRMFAALRHAAKSHQVIVLTCHERAFAELGGHQVILDSWDDRRAAA